MLMSDNKADILYNEITSAYLERGYMHGEGLTKDQVNRSRDLFKAMAYDLIDRGDETGRIHTPEILTVWKNHLYPESEEPAEGWLEHCYAVLRNQLFPHLPAPENADRFRTKRANLLQLMRGVFEYERKVLPFDPTRDFRLLSDVQISAGHFNPEYIKMRKMIRHKYVYEFMRIGTDITPFNTLGHISGVHYVAMYMAYQLHQVGFPVDLGIISGAAAMHDIGKYGCRPFEEKRVPYLHYYYTNYCLSRNALPTIAHIAANHSTWDLELENLSVESLLLIYADFRVKSTRENGKEIIHFYSLKEAFDVILNKLDNVDEAKKHRYVKVYAKLKDFEDLMIENGVSVDIPKEVTAHFDEQCIEKPVPIRKRPALLQGNEIVQELKFRAIGHNILLMSRFNDPAQFASLIESARSESNWIDARTYLTILGEYSTYMSEEQKNLTLHFLYEMLAHHASDIREQAAALMGRIIANYREEYKKELPKDVPSPDITSTNIYQFKEYLHKILNPDHKITEQHKKWITASADFFVEATLKYCNPARRHFYIDVLEKCYDIDNLHEDHVIVLMIAALRIDSDWCTDSFSQTLRFFSKNILGSYSQDVDLITLDVLDHYFGDSMGEFTNMRRRDILGISQEELTESQLSSMFLDNLKTRTSWNRKLANIRYMLDSIHTEMGQSRILQIAIHFANLIKNSETITVRKYAAESLFRILPELSADQVNELMIEIFNGLEIEDYQFTRFLPDVLGVIVLYLPPKELDEVIGELEKLLNSGTERSACAALQTIAVILEEYDIYHFKEKENVKEARINRLLGMLLKGFAYYNAPISQEAFRMIGEHIFHSDKLSLAQKHNLATRCFKRLVTIIPFAAKERENLQFYNNAAGLLNIYRFISEYQTEAGEFQFPERTKVAFFPGTFDPFSLGHKAIATTIRDMGFDVYLAVDEFSWSKKTLPHMLREKILSMSIASEGGLYVFPDDISVNIASPEDLAELRSLFPGQEVYIAVGSDVVANSSCYRMEPTENSIHTFSHIIFARESKKLDEDTGDIYPITGDVVHLKLKKYYEDISSTKIRDNVDMGRDISNLLDPMVQNYIYDKNFYSREPAYKHVLQAQDLGISDYKHDNYTAVANMKEELTGRGYDFDALWNYLSQENTKTIYIESGHKNHKVSAFASARRFRTHDLLTEFQDPKITATIRKQAHGGIAVIGAFYANANRSVSNLNQILLTELLTSLLAKDYAYAIYHPEDPTGYSGATIEALKLQGFVNISDTAAHPVYAVDLTRPIVIFRDVETVIKAPLNKIPRVQKAIDDAHNHLLHTFTEMFPGKLILSFNTSAVYSKIVDLVARDNGVSTVPDPSRKRGPYLAVPFGKALADVAVPNTITKALRTEKYFRNDLSGFTVREAENYPSLENQARMLKSFHRPVILIDDLLHKGQRMNNIDPILRVQNIDVHKIIVGLLTGNARDTMTVRGRDVESAYFIPSISMWLNERDCYPFIGGDSIERPDGTASRSINFTLPYTSFSFVGGKDPKNIYKYSLTCLENARDILKVLEQEYQATFGKKLTLRRLGAIINSPRMPLLGADLDYNEHLSPSQYVESDIRKAQRLSLYRESEVNE